MRNPSSDPHAVPVGASTVVVGSIAGLAGGLGAVWIGLGSLGVWLAVGVRPTMRYKETRECHFSATFSRA